MSVSPDLRELYQEYILDHGKRPRNFRLPEPSTHSGDGYNPLCGDKITVFVRTEGETIRDISFVGSGCAISTAAASLMTEALRGKTTAEARALFAAFHEMLTGSGAPQGLDKLAVFAGVREFPVRVKCATLAWHTMRAALDKKQELVTTE